MLLTERMRMSQTLTTAPLFSRLFTKAPILWYEDRAFISKGRRTHSFSETISPGLRLVKPMPASFAHELRSAYRAESLPWPPAPMRTFSTPALRALFWEKSTALSFSKVEALESFCLSDK